MEYGEWLLSLLLIVEAGTSEGEPKREPRRSFVGGGFYQHGFATAPVSSPKKIEQTDDCC